MIALPWYGRLVIDSALIFVPFLALTCKPLLTADYPRGVTTFLTNSRRTKRRKGTQLLTQTSSRSP